MLSLEGNELSLSLLHPGLGSTVDSESGNESLGSQNLSLSSLVGGDAGDSRECGLGKSKLAGTDTGLSSLVESSRRAVSYTHLTLPTIYSV